ncbi:MAG: hypothetical protein RLZZ116_1081 [Planctomycetota bacterium]|jgi:hypothetical protein
MAMTMMISAGTAMMTTSEGTGGPASDSVDGADQAMLREAAARAVDFRGDVTLELHDGRTVVGYAFDAQVVREADAVIRVLPADSDARVNVPLASIRRLTFSGKDAASGKSWENWLRRYAAKKLAGESASIESDPL